MTHVGDPPQDEIEINGNLIALNALAGIPLAVIQGFRAPFLNVQREHTQPLRVSPTIPHLPPPSPSLTGHGRDDANGESKVDDAATLEYMKNTTTYPGVNPSNSMINESLHWAQEQRVWIVSNEQLLAWMMDPKAISQLDPNEAGLLSPSDFPFFTCMPRGKKVPDGQHARFRCQSAPLPLFPPSTQSFSLADVVPLYTVPTNCSTAFWDPIGGKCLCTSTDSEGRRWQREQRLRSRTAIQQQGLRPAPGVWAATLVGAVGAMVGVWGVAGGL
ncbi:hypothetical protein GGX14DRAFT_619136 [Mycena pura]|uniref:Uncharacterized protein n=1 Tax=Mycena pura TaxID=153505 RepID=A0AAD6VIA6_9AGAR|nr:hypothetical protein GGX14DRAFT_619136 [Mycena pura]